MEDEKYMIRDVLPVDAAEISEIYNHYIANTIITFEEDTVTEDIIGERMKEVKCLQLPWFVAEQDGNILGYCYAGKWKDRSAFRHATEVTVYLHPNHVGKGIGVELYRNLLQTLKSQGIHVAIGGIALPNEASIKLHERMGFLKVAQLKEVGFKFNRWIDVEYWQRIL
jgi:phosphinothricin acetyltransferase